MNIPDGFGELAFLYELIDTGEVMSCTIGTNNPTGLSPATLAATGSDAWLTGFTAASTLDSYRFLGCYALINDGGTMLSFQTTDNIDGTVNAEPVSPAVAVGVKKTTFGAGKKYRGRMYLPPAVLAEANVNAAGVIDSATVTSLQAKVDTFQDTYNAAGPPSLYLLHNDATDPTPIVQMQVRSNVRTQRRRQHLL